MHAPNVFFPIRIPSFPAFSSSFLSDASLHAVRSSSNPEGRRDAFDFHGP
jgi:hypothetical protein